MIETDYYVYVNDEELGCLPLQYAIILLEGIMNKFYNEPGLKVTIQRASYEGA